MALTISDLANGVDTTNDPSLTTGATVTASVGDVLLLCIAAANSGVSGAAAVISSIADDAGGSTNVYTQRGSTGNQTAGAANDGASQFWYECPVTTALSSNVITVTFSANNAQKSIQVYKMVPGAGQKPGFISVGTALAGASRTSHAATAVTVANGHTIFAMAAIETDDTVTGDTDTTNGSWSSVLTRLADGGADANTMSCSSQFKTVSAGGSQDWIATTVSGRDSVSNTINYAPVPIIVAASGAYNETGSTVILDAKMPAATDSYALTGTAAALSKGVKIAADFGSYAETGSSVVLGAKMPAAADSYAETGSAAALTKNIPIVAGSGSDAETGTDATFAVVMPSASGTYTETGSTVIFDVKMSAESGPYTETGSAVTLAVGTPVDSGSYAETGSTVVFDVKMTAGSGTYVWTGAAATLTFSGGNPVLVADPGSYVETGFAVVLAVGLPVAAGSYAETGQSATFDTKIPLGSGSYAEAGSAVIFDVRMAAGSGSYVEVGQDATLDWSGSGIVLVAGSGAYVESGSPAVLGLSMAALTGSFGFAGSAANPYATHVLSASLTANTRLRVDLLGNTVIIVPLEGEA